MKNKLLHKSLLVIAFAIINTLTPQFGWAQAKAAWQTDMQSPVIWQQLTPLGNLLVETAKGLQGIDVETGKTLWSRPELVNIAESACEPIDNTPYVLLTTSESKPAVYIIEPFEGNILFSSKEAGLEKIIDKFFVYKSNTILILGNSPGQKGSTMAMVDMGTGKKIWSKDNDFGLVSSYYDLGSDQLLMLTFFYLYKINVKTGDVIWKQSIDPAVGKISALSGLVNKMDANSANNFTKDDLISTIMVPAGHTENCYVGVQIKTTNTEQSIKGGPVKTSYSYKCKYCAYKLSTGDYIWKNTVEVEGKMGVVVPDENGLLICSKESSLINMIDYTTGLGMWAKKRGFSADGPVLGTAPVAGGILLSCKRGGSDCSLNILDPKAGTLKFPKEAKLNGSLNYIETLPCGLLVGSEEEVNLLNLTTGVFSFEKGLKGGSGVIATKDNFTYIYSNGDELLYKLDRTTGKLSQLGATKIDFQGKESPTALEIRDKGILLTSEQNIALVDFSGKLLFNKYYKAPAQSGFTKALLIASAVRAAYYTAAFSYYSAAFGAASQSIQVKNQASKNEKDITASVSGYFGDAAQTGMSYTGKFLAEATKRFKASGQSQDFVFIMTENEQKKYDLLQADKKSGDKISSIDLSKDKTPVYQVDAITNAIYYKNGSNTIQKFQF